MKKMTSKMKLKIALCFTLLISTIFGVTWAMPRVTSPAQIIGVFWQPNLQTKPVGNWNLIGATTFVPQFGMVQGKSWFPTSTIPQWQPNPDWNKVQNQAWSQHLILGLSGEYDEKKARAHVKELGLQSKQFIKEVQLSKPPSSYYFPVEADPSWLGVTRLANTLNTLPAPLWISIYSGQAEPKNYDLWLNSWLPPHTSVFFQDGVGTGVRTPEQALQVLNQLQQRFGKERIVIVLEAFRPKANGGFRAAYPWEIIDQLSTYQNQKVFIFDGPHYLNHVNVYAIALWQKLTS